MKDNTILTQDMIKLRNIKTIGNTDMFIVSKVIKAKYSFVKLVTIATIRLYAASVSEISSFR